VGGQRTGTILDYYRILLSSPKFNESSDSVQNVIEVTITKVGKKEPHSKSSVVLLSTVLCSPT